jgi:membrane protein YdbS with pleckstrin-like domain
MICTVCGLTTRPDALFCSNCGSRVEDELTRVRMVKPAFSTTVEEDERVIFNTGPTLVYIGFGYAFSIILAFMITAALSALNFSVTVSVLAGFLVVLIPAYKHLRQKLVRYMLTDSRLEIDSGMLVKRTRNIPLHSVQNITVCSSILQRVLGIGDLLVENANEMGRATVLHNIRDPRGHADMILRELRRWR